MLFHSSDLEAVSHSGSRKIEQDQNKVNKMLECKNSFAKKNSENLEMCVSHALNVIGTQHEDD